MENDSLEIQNKIRNKIEGAKINIDDILSPSNQNSVNVDYNNENLPTDEGDLNFSVEGSNELDNEAISVVDPLKDTTKPVSNDTAFAVFHFTDLHITKDSIPIHKKYFDEICTYLNQTKSSLQVSNFFIVITGDIFDSNNFEDECVGLFLNFIENISSLLSDSNVYFIFSVGNHDMNSQTCEIKDKEKPTRKETICTHLEDLKINVDKNINDLMQECSEINGVCKCKEYVDYNYNGKNATFVKKIYYKLDSNLISLIEQIKSCEIFKGDNNKKNTIINIIDSNRKKLNGQAIKDIFNDREKLIQELNPQNTYGNFKMLFEKIEKLINKFSKTELITFLDDLNHTEGYKKINLTENFSVGIKNINTSWMSSIGDHYNFRSMYITNQTGAGSLAADDYNIILFHHPLEYLAEECNDDVRYITDNIIDKAEYVNGYSVSDYLFNSGYCGHIHILKLNEMVENNDDTSDTNLYKSLDKNIYMPGALVPYTEVDGDFKLFKENEIENAFFSVVDSTVFEEYNVNIKYFLNIAFSQSIVSIKENSVVFEENQRVVLTTGN